MRKQNERDPILNWIFTIICWCSILLLLDLLTGCSRVETDTYLPALEQPGPNLVLEKQEPEKRTFWQKVFFTSKEDNPAFWLGPGH